MVSQTPNHRHPTTPNDDSATSPRQLLRLVSEQLRELALRQEKLEALVVEVHAGMAKPELVKDLYSISEAAELLGRRPYTIRNWCRLQRIHAEKTHSGRGVDPEWRISREEIIRIRNEGLLPVPRRY
jgi:hypothetical protein